MSSPTKNAVEQFNSIVSLCKKIFISKTKDYGTSWTNLRRESLTDQIFIKAKRIRTIEETKEQKVSDSVENEYRGILNYCIIALMQRVRNSYEYVELDEIKVTSLYEDQLKLIKELMVAKNHDYGEAWREMRVKSITDQILQKLIRIRKIEMNDEHTINSEGIEANYQDIVNYCIFALIKLKEK
ncbi:hypothetical protein COB64_00180 [Candidatus Wolfebacteria bacterium]|nr:MAG: hypothetical protein COB64_00180 [Candidatus Wolfebacteria bacterium]